MGNWGPYTVINLGRIQLSPLVYDKSHIVTGGELPQCPSGYEALTSTLTKDFQLPTNLPSAFYRQLNP